MVQQKISGQKVFVLRQPRQQIIIYVFAEIVFKAENLRAEGFCAEAAPAADNYLCIRKNSF